MLSTFLSIKGVSLFAKCDVMFQEEPYEEEEEDGVEERILCSSFSPTENAELYELPDSEALFLPSNMDSSQMVFKFKEVSPTHDYQSNGISIIHPNVSFCLNNVIL